MKKIEEKTIPGYVVKPTKKQIESVYCDISGHKVDTASRFTTHSCCLCKRDICQKCVKYVNEDGGDYYDAYCVHCHKLKYETYAEEREDIERNYEDDLEKLDDQIREESLKVSNDKEN